jgi:hypothetical protein
MNVFEVLQENKDTTSRAGKNLADAAVVEAMKKIRDQILFLKENSRDTSIRHHLKEINKDNKDTLLGSIPGEDIIDFNEVILKGNWKEYLERKKEKKLTKYIKEEISDQDLATLQKDSERLSPADNFRLSFRAMIDHYARNLEIEELEKKKQTERQILKENFMSKLDELEKNKPHVVAEIKNINPDIFRRPDYEVALKLDERSLIDYEKGLIKYFDLKTDSKSEEHSPEKKVEVIMADPRFRYYCALRELLEIEGPCNPQIFLN